MFQSPSGRCVPASYYSAVAAETVRLRRAGFHDHCTLAEVVETAFGFTPAPAAVAPQSTPTRVEERVVREILAGVL